MIYWVLEIIGGHSMTRDLEVSPEDDWDQMWLLMMEYYWDLDLVEQW